MSDRVTDALKELTEALAERGERVVAVVDLGDAAPDTGFVELTEVFHLEDQLAALHD